MALFALGKRQTPVTTIPHQLLFNSWKARLEPLEIRAIGTALDHLVSKRNGGEVYTAHWLPCDISPMGRLDWEGSALMKIWDKACERDCSRTCWCFAIFLWEHMLSRPEAWHFKPLDLDNVPMAATRYSRCQVPSARATKFAALHESMFGAATSIL